jgi:hypothetical protein
MNNFSPNVCSPPELKPLSAAVKFVNVKETINETI